MTHRPHITTYDSDAVSELLRALGRLISRPDVEAYARYMSLLDVSKAAERVSRSARAVGQ